MNKAIIVGASTAGKTTLLRHLKESTDLPIEESDDVLILMNGGTYPHNSEYKMNVLAPKMVNEVLNRENVVFFTNTHYFQIEDLIKARVRGFKVIQLSIERGEMERRNKNRIEHEGYDNLSRYFDKMLLYQKEIYEKKLVDSIIDMNQSIENIAKELLQHIK